MMVLFLENERKMKIPCQWPETRRGNLGSHTGVTAQINGIDERKGESTKLISSDEPLFVSLLRPDISPGLLS